MNIFENNIFMFISLKDFDNSYIINSILSPVSLTFNKKIYESLMKIIYTNIIFNDFYDFKFIHIF